MRAAREISPAVGCVALSGGLVVYRQPALNITIAKAYLIGADPRLTERTWSEVVAEMCSGKKSLLAYAWNGHSEIAPLIEFAR